MPLNYNYSANIRNLAMIEGLSRNGNIVDILTYRPNEKSGWFDESMQLDGVRKVIYVGNDIASDAVRNKDNFNRTCVSKIKSCIANLIKRYYPWDVRQFQVTKTKRIELEEHYDYLISSSDPKSSHNLAKKVIKDNKKNIGLWIQYWGDPFAGDINKSSKLPSGIIKSLENNLLKKADKVVYVSPFTLESQKRNFSKCASKMVFLPIPVKKDDEEDIIQRTGINELKIGYYGAYYSKDRDIMPLVNAVNQTAHRLEICGSSDLTIRDSDNVQVYGKVSYDEVKSRENERDVLVCICNKHGTQIPGKAYHYAVTNKYILLIIDGEYKEEIKEYFMSYNRYIICDNKEESIKKALLELGDAPDLCKPCETFSVEVIAQKLID